MSETTTNMALTVWNSLTDPYDSSQLVDNFVKIDTHNHASGKGVQIPNTGLVNNKVTIGSTDVSLGATVTTLSGLTTVNATTFNGALGTVTGDTSGNAGTATKLATARKINGTSFDGSTNITTPYITSVANMPASPSTGDEIYYQAATNVVWHLRYNGTQWDYVGGTLLRTDVISTAPLTAGIVNTSGSDTYGPIDGSDTTASITLPAFAGACLYRIEIWGSLAKGSSSATSILYMSYKTSAVGAVASDDDSFSVVPVKSADSYGTTSGGNITAIYGGGSSTPVTGFRASVKTITGGTTLTAQFKQAVAGNPIYVNAHGIAARPIYITT